MKHMTTFQMIATVISFLILGSVSLMLALQCAQYFMGQQVSIRKILEGLRPKLWMTVGLGFFFMTFYAALILLGTHFMNPETRLYLFDLMRNRPVLFIYLGLCAFVMISLSILIVRSIIKRIYNSRRRM